MVSLHIRFYDINVISAFYVINASTFSIISIATSINFNNLIDI